MHEKFKNIHFNSRLLALEMEKRGIRVEHVEGTKILISNFKGHQEIIDNTDLSVMPSSLRYLLDDKYLTKKFLTYLELPVVEGAQFSPKDFEQAKKYAKKILPVTIKPVKGCHGYGVRPNVESIKEFEFEYKKLANNLEYETDLLVEKNMDLEEYRLTVTRNGFFAAVYRIKPSVTGDGKSTIAKLIEKINKKRRLRENCLCEIWMGDNEVVRYLKKQNLTLKTMPKKGEHVILRPNVNVCTGAECMDITDAAHPYYRNLAFEILYKIPNLPYCSIDIFTDDILKHTGKEKYYIGEINPDPGISLHTHPSIGTSRDLPKALIDLIYPETKK